MKKKKESFLMQDNWKAISFLLSPEQLKRCEDEDIRVNFIDGIMGEVKVVFDTLFWTFDEVKHFDYPKEWFDAFKLKYFPLWLLKLFPAKMTRVIIKEVVPHLPKKFKSKLYKEIKEYSIPLISLEDPTEYSFTFEKFDKKQDEGC